MDTRSCHGYPPKKDKKMDNLPPEQSLLHRPVQSVYSRIEKAEAAESGACRVFDRAPVAEKEKHVRKKNPPVG